MASTINASTTGAGGVIVTPDASGTLSLQGGGNTGISIDSTGAVTAATLMPSGTVLPYAGSSAPTGFLLLYGQAVSRTTYATLFGVIGTTYGTGDGSTTFNLPDMRGRAAFGKDDMGGTAASRVTNGVSGITGTTLGASGGNQNVQQHNHGVTDPTHYHSFLQGDTTPASYTSRAGQGDGNNNFYTATTGASTGISIQNYGSGTSANMPPALVLNYIIKF